MIDKGFISVHRETLAFALGLKCHGHKNKTEQAADRRHAERQIRAALAEPAHRACGKCGKPTACGKMICEECGYERLPAAWKVEVDGMTLHHREPMDNPRAKNTPLYEHPAPPTAPKMCDCNQGRLPCTCKEPAPAEFDKGAALESLANQVED